jgi:hypothetical protein
MPFDELRGTDAQTALAEAWAWPQAQLLGYHHPQYQSLLTTLLGDELRCLILEQPGRGLCGVLPCRIAHTSAGEVINAFPFFGSNGAVLTAPAVGDAVCERLLCMFRQLARRPEVLSATLYTPFLTNPAPWLANLQPDDVRVKFTQYLTFEQPPAWPAKRRADLKRAADRGYRVRRGQPTDAAAIIALYEENCRRAGIPRKPAAFISGTLAIEERLGRTSPMRWLVATLDDRVVAALLYGQGLETGSYILPCASLEERAGQPNALLIDVAVRTAYEEGVRAWNFESSPAWDDQVFKFKSRWGAREMPFVLCVFYSAQGHRPPPDVIQAARHDAPYYFVAPVGNVSGVWPSHVPLPAGYAKLAPHLA